MNPVWLIDKKRQGLAHSRDELAFIVDGVMDGSLPDYQLAAWLMAVCCNGLNLEETTWLTDLYVKSGQVLDFTGLDGIVVDKHSTGGVGDKTTLILAPLLASVGLKVAKLSGRGLGFTGGTIDKLEAIPGFQTALASDVFLNQVKSLGIALGSQTAELAPADGKIYALRDVTATVASIPLIAASVVSKKIAAGAQVITLDIKVGDGAFMKTLNDAKALAFTCREVGKALGRQISTVISTMDQPLGYAIGHTTEVIEAIETLRGRGPEDLTELCLILGGVTLVDAGKAKSLDAAKALLKQQLHNGEALACFKTLIESQHGDSGVLDNPNLMPQPQHKILVQSTQDGYIAHCDALKIAQAAKALGAGRQSKSEPIDLAVGVVLKVKTGQHTDIGDPIAELWVNTKGQAEATELVQSAFSFTGAPTQVPVLVDDIVTSEPQYN